MILRRSLHPIGLPESQLHGVLSALPALGLSIAAVALREMAIRTYETHWGIQGHSEAFLIQPSDIANPESVGESEYEVAMVDSQCVS